MITVNTVLTLKKELALLLAETLPLGLKYKLEVFNKALKEKTVEIEKIRDELIIKYSGGVTLNAFIDNEPNPKYKEYLDEWTTLIEVEDTLPIFEKFSLSKIENLETTHSYPTVFEYLVDGTS